MKVHNSAAVCALSDLIVTFKMQGFIWGGGVKRTTATVIFSLNIKN